MHKRSCRAKMLKVVHPFLLHFIFLLLLVQLAFSVLEPSPSCPTSCGNVSIPFPYGIGPDCAVDESFEIICSNNVSGSQTLGMLDGKNVTNVVVAINVSGSQIRIRPQWDDTISTCYNNNRTKVDFLPYRLNDTQYTWSDKNWITTIGCDDMSTMMAYIGNTQRVLYCVSFCSNGTGHGYCPSENGDAYSAGDGCCWSRIPKGTSRPVPYFDDDHDNYNRTGKLFPCAHQFIREKLAGDQSTFSYPFKYLNDSTSIVSSGLVSSRTWLLDWRITSSQNCRQATQNSTSFACLDIRNCVDFDVPDVGGYICRCPQGYTGNPYIVNGCTDVNECNAKPNPCHSSSICTNTQGLFECSCPRWHHGDGSNGCEPSKTINVVIGLGSGIGFLLLLSICLCLNEVFQKRKIRSQNMKFFKRNGGLLLQQQTNGTMGKTDIFSSRELEKATDNFNESRFLGQGGQGTVYKGMLSDGKIVAIKKAKLVDENQLERFIKEVVILSQINHRNVVKLFGCCLETEVPLLVYEYVPNGTLFELIHDINSDFPFTWNMRLKMAADVAGAVAYLHSASSIPIYHRDIKSSNILLDEKFVVKVSDFGTSRSVAVDQTHLTTQVQGTMGYLDPEYLQSSQFTEKSDVYSFGVVLVELLTRERPISFTRSGEERTLVTWFLVSLETNSVGTILDAQIFGQGQKEEVMKVVSLAKRCLNLMGKMRPTMKEVALELESLKMSQTPSTAIDKYHETKFLEARPMVIPGTEYTWTTNDTSGTATSSPSDLYPIMSRNF